MKIAVVGLWHLGTVTAACLASKGYDVIAFDSNKEIISDLKEGKLPVYEPGLKKLLSKGKLHFTTKLQDLAKAEIIWVTLDTPVDHNDKADVDLVQNEIKYLFPHLQENSLVIISSQMPAGSTRKLQMIAAEKFPKKDIRFAYSPENLRLGKAIEVFSHPDRVIVGLDNDKEQERISALLSPFSSNIIFMSIESAEMTKHAINAFLANSVIFINEISALCERVGANAYEVAQGLKSDSRIGPKAYLRPGGPIAGGTLMRDLNYLIDLGEEHEVETILFSILIHCNRQHQSWVYQKLVNILKCLHGKKIAVLGLTYKVGTDTLRRSTAVEMCEWLNSQGAEIIAYDPLVKRLPSELSCFINLKNTMLEAIDDADAVVISTECVEFSELKSGHLLANSKKPFVIDPSGFLKNSLGSHAEISYCSVGFQP